MIHNSSKIAILLATYNNAAYITAQLNSLFAQSFKDWTLFVRDDGSTDDTMAKLQPYMKHGNVVVLEDNKGNLRPRDNFMHLLHEVESDFYMFMDADDIWLPNKIENEYNAIKNFPINQPALVITNMRLVDGNLQEISPSFWKSIRFDPNLMGGKKYQAYMGYTTGCTMMFNHRAKQLSFPMEEYAPMHDWWVAMTIYKNEGNVAYLTEPQMLYRKHGGNATGDFVASQKGKSLMTRWHEMMNHYRLLKDAECVANIIDYIGLKFIVKYKQKKV